MDKAELAKDLTAKINAYAKRGNATGEDELALFVLSNAETILAALTSPAPLDGEPSDPRFTAMNVGSFEAAEIETAPFDTAILSSHAGIAAAAKVDEAVGRRRTLADEAVETHWPDFFEAWWADNQWRKREALNYGDRKCIAWAGFYAAMQIARTNPEALSPEPPTEGEWARAIEAAAKVARECGFAGGFADEGLAVAARIEALSQADAPKRGEEEGK